MLMNTQIENKTVRILLVDDHQVVRTGLRALIERQAGMQVIGEAGSVTEALAQTLATDPDLVLMDIRLPDGTGFDACRLIKSERPATRVLVLTSYADDDVVLKAIAAGAEGYLLKEVDNSALLRSMRAVANGQSILDPAVTQAVMGRLQRGPEPLAGDRLASLSAQERRVISLVAEGKTNKEIAQDMGLSDKTVKNYFSNILDKLSLSRRSQAVAFYLENAPRDAQGRPTWR